MGVRKRGNDDYEEGYRNGYANGYAVGKRSMVRKDIKDFSNLEEVVRCDNCIWNEKNIDGVNEHWCTYFGKDIEDKAYCSYGETVE